MTPERIAARAIIKWIRQVVPGAIVQAVPNEQAAKSSRSYERARFGAARKASGCVSGFPDLIVLAPHGRVVLLEVKRPPERSATTGQMLVGKMGIAQEPLHERIRALDHCVEVVTCIDTARTALLRAGISTIEAAGQPTPQPRYYRASKRRRMPVLAA